MLQEVANTGLDIERFKAFYHSWHFKILQDLYQQDIKEENTCIKALFLESNAQKSNLELFSTLKKLDNDSQYRRYYEKLIALLMYQNIDERAFQKGLEKINEKTEKRKGNGVYYTPDDVSSFIITNSLGLVNKKEGVLYENAQILIDEIDDNFLSCSIFDPTCGTGAFVVKAFDIKLDLARKRYGHISDKTLLLIVNSLYGNDIDSFSTYISQTRLLFKIINISKTINVQSVLDILQKNFFNFDFISEYHLINKKFDFIVGNPPYVEKGKLLDKTNAKYGNIYADVVENSFSLLKKNGVLGYIIPLSYVSTPRFSRLRRYIKENTSVEYILSFADRPDCLFSGVHQKLNIILAKKQQTKKHNIYTSDYIYWYKNQRENLFNNLQLVLNKYQKDDFYPKLGNNIETNIYKKITSGLCNINSIQGGEHPLYVNMRATFWLKSFIEKPYKSAEYKEFLFDSKNIHFVNIILNSSLFWWFWVKISDCWHLTNKEFITFTIPDLLNVDYRKCCNLSKKLNIELERTKEKVDTKQTMYEYKHKRCKHTIDLIDDYLAELYNLSNAELEYIKHYKDNYRLGISDAGRN